MKWSRMQERHIDFFSLCSHSYCIVVAAHRFVLRGILKLPAGSAKRVPCWISTALFTVEHGIGNAVNNVVMAVCGAR